MEQYKILEFKDEKQRERVGPYIVLIGDEYLGGTLVPTFYPMTCSMLLLKERYPKIDFSDIQLVEVELTVNKVNMTTTEIKKVVYKQKPTARLQFIRKGVAYYEANVSIPIEDTTIGTTKVLNFQVPVTDMGDADFHVKMEAKLMLRWLINPEDN